MDEKLRILLVEDSHEDVVLIEHALKKEEISFISEVVDSKKDYQEKLLAFSPDVVISDHSLPQFNSMEALELFQDYRRDYNPAASFILVTGTVSEEFAVDIMKKGADDYILKDRLRRLPSAVKNASEKNRSREEKMRAQEEKFQLLEILQKSLHEIYIFDPENLQLEYINEEGLRNLGYSADEIKDLHLGEIIADFHERRLKDILHAVERSRKGRIYERDAIRKDGSTYPVQIHLQSIRYGNRKHFLANVLDITETREYQRQKELALFIQNAFDQNRSLSESLEPVAGEFGIQAGAAAVEIWARDFEATELKRYAVWTADELPAPESGQHYAERAVNDQMTVTADLQEQQTGKAGDIQVYRGIVSSPIISGNEVTAVVNFFTSVFQEEPLPVLPLKEGVQDKLAGSIKRKKTEEELQKIFDFSPDVLAVIGKEGYIKKLSPSFERILGYSEQEMLEIPFISLMHPDDLVLFEQWQMEELQDGEVAHYESRWRDKDGQYHWFSWSVTNFLPGGLQFAGGKDITQFKKQVEAIERQNEKLSQIAWEQSHTVRAPLSRLLACVDYLEEKKVKKDPLLGSIKETAHELDEIVKSIVSKAEVLR